VEPASGKFSADSAQGGQTAELFDEVIQCNDGNDLRNFSFAHREKVILAGSSIRIVDQPRQTLCIFSGICKSEPRKHNKARGQGVIALAAGPLCNWECDPGQLFS
jgi:hypothetical protein